MSYTIRIELTEEEAATVVAALSKAKSTEGDLAFYNSCVETRAKIVQAIGNAVVGKYPYGALR